MKLQVMFVIAVVALFGALSAISVSAEPGDGVSDAPIAFRTSRSPTRVTKSPTCVRMVAHSAARIPNFAAASLSSATRVLNCAAPSSNSVTLTQIYAGHSQAPA